MIAAATAGAVPARSQSCAGNLTGGYDHDGCRSGHRGRGIHRIPPGGGAGTTRIPGHGPWCSTTCGAHAPGWTPSTGTSSTRLTWCSATCATRRRCVSSWRARRSSTTWPRSGRFRTPTARPRSFVDTNTIGTHARPRGRARLPHAEDGAHLDQRDLRHRAHGADQRVASAAGPVTVRGLQDRRGQAGRVVPPELRGARRSRCGRSTPSARGSPPAPSSRRSSRSSPPAPGSSGSARWTRPGTSPTSPTPSRRSSNSARPRPRRCSARCSTAGRATTSRSASWPRRSRR